MRTTRLICLCLEPPGPIQRELALFRRRLFAARGEPSALALPEFLFLGQLQPPGSGEGRAALSSQRSILPEVWKKAQGEFSSGPAFLEEGKLYLGLEGPLEELRRGAAEALALEALPLLSDAGFFLMRGRGGNEGEEPSPESGSGELLEALIQAQVPVFSFFSAQLLLLELSFGDDPFRGLAWREKARARRLKGPPAGSKSVVE